MLIVGGGPAGATAALNLAPFCNVLVVEKSSAATSRIGESLVPAARRLFTDMGIWEEFVAQGHSPSFGNCSAWGASKLAYSSSVGDADGAGWHLERGRFDLWLRDVASRRGATFLTPGHIASLEEDQDGWRVGIQLDDASMKVHCRFLIDATGRQASIGKRLGADREVFDNLAAGWVYGVDAATTVSATTFIEAVEGGWWYTAPLPGSRRVVVFHTDSNLPTSEVFHSHSNLTAAIEQTSCLRFLLSDSGFDPDPTHGVAAAASSRLSPNCGKRWASCGDAALAFDPLSSQGIFNALYTGLAVAESVERSLRQELDELRGYEYALESIWSAYRTHLTAWYGLENRWPESEFWVRRRWVE